MLLFGESLREIRWGGARLWMVAAAVKRAPNILFIMLILFKTFFVTLVMVSLWIFNASGRSFRVMAVSSLLGPRIDVCWIVDGGGGRCRGQNKACRFLVCRLEAHFATVFRRFWNRLQGSSGPQARQRQSSNFVSSGRVWSFKEELRCWVIVVPFTAACVYVLHWTP